MKLTQSTTFITKTLALLLSINTLLYAQTSNERVTMSKGNFKKPSYSAPLSPVEQSSVSSVSSVSNTANASTNSAGKSVTSTNSFYDYIIFDAIVELYEDNDQDGYFHNFSLVFDADIINAAPDIQRVVYAELYLSENQGDWFHIFTTDEFLLTGDSAEDAYEITTELFEGYRENFYDARVVLFQVDITEPVAIYDSDDNASLAALPLESVDYDSYYQEHDHDNGGHSLWLLILSTIAFLVKVSHFHSRTS